MLELVMALLIFQIGVLGVVGMVLTAQRTIARSQVTLRATLAARRLGDSLQAGGVVGTGMERFPWGVVSWVGGGGGTVWITATGGTSTDTLAFLRYWGLPRAIGPEPDSLPAEEVR